MNFSVICTLFITLFLSPTLLARAYYTSIAINEEVGAYHFDNHNIQETADKEAIRKCEKFAKDKNKAFKWGYTEEERACKIVVQIKGKQCASLANDDDIFGWGITRGKRVQDRTRRDALRTCRKAGGRNCKIVLEVCSK